MVIRPTAPTIERWYRTQAEIEAYRREKLTVDLVLGSLAAGSGAVLLPVEVGIGKTTLIDGLVGQQLTTGTPYGLIVYLTSRRDVLLERPWLRRAGVTVLIGRPRERCGDLDREWVRIERASCGAVGRSTLCTQCANSQSCTWPTQMTKDALEGSRVVAGVQSYLTAVPDFVSLLMRRTACDHVLIIIDEAFIVDAAQRTHLDLPPSRFRVIARRAWASCSRSETA